MRSPDEWIDEQEDFLRWYASSHSYPWEQELYHDYDSFTGDDYDSSFQDDADIPLRHAVVRWLQKKGSGARADYSVLSVTVMTLGLILVVEVIRHRIDHAAMGKPYVTAVLENIYAELTTLGIVEFFVFLIQEYHVNLNKDKKEVFAAVHFALFYTAILNAFQSVFLAVTSTHVSHQMWVRTEALELSHYVEIREEFDRVQGELQKTRAHHGDHHQQQRQAAAEQSRLSSDGEDLQKASPHHSVDDEYVFELNLRGLRSLGQTFVDRLRYPRLKRRYNDLLVQVRFHELRVHFLQAYKLPARVKISDYLVRCEQQVLIKLVHVSSFAWLLLTASANLLYYILGIVGYKTQDPEVVGTTLIDIFFASMGVFVLLALLVENKVKKVFREVMHERDLWEVIDDEDRQLELAKKQMNFFWFGSPKLVITLIQFMQFGYAVALSVVIMFWEEINDADIPMGYYLLTVFVCYLLFVRVSAEVIPRYTLCTNLGQLVDRKRLNETVALFHLQEERRKRYEAEIMREYFRKEEALAAEREAAAQHEMSPRIDAADALALMSLEPISETIVEEVAPKESDSTRAVNPEIESSRNLSREERKTRRRRQRSISDGVALMASMTKRTEDLDLDKRMITISDDTELTAKSIEITATHDASKPSARLDSELVKGGRGRRVKSLSDEVKKMVNVFEDAFASKGSSRDAASSNASVASEQDSERIANLVKMDTEQLRAQLSQDELDKLEKRQNRNKKSGETTADTESEQGGGTRARRRRRIKSLSADHDLFGPPTQRVSAAQRFELKQVEEGKRAEDAETKKGESKDDHDLPVRNRVRRRLKSLSADHDLFGPPTERLSAAERLESKQAEESKQTEKTVTETAAVSENKEEFKNEPDVPIRKRIRRRLKSLSADHDLFGPSSERVSAAKRLELKQVGNKPSDQIAEKSEQESAKEEPTKEGTTEMVDSGAASAPQQQKSEVKGIKFDLSSKASKNDVTLYTDDISEGDESDVPEVDPVFVKQMTVHVSDTKPFKERCQDYYASKKYVVVSNVFGTMIAFFGVGSRVERFLHTEDIVPRNYISFDFNETVTFWSLSAWLFFFLVNDGLILWSIDKDSMARKYRVVWFAAIIDIVIVALCWMAFWLAEVARCCETDGDDEMRFLAEKTSTKSITTTFGPAPCSCPYFGSRLYGGLGNIEPYVSLICLRLFRFYAAKRIVRYINWKQGLRPTYAERKIDAESERNLDPFDVNRSQHAETEHGHNGHDDHGHGPVIGTAAQIWQDAVGKHPEIVEKYGAFSAELLQVMLGIPIVEALEPDETTRRDDPSENPLQEGSRNLTIEKKYANLDTKAQEIIMAGKVGYDVRQTTLGPSFMSSTNSSGLMNSSAFDIADPIFLGDAEKDQAVFDAPNARLVRSMRRCDRKLLPILDKWTVVDVVMTRFEMVYFDAVDVGDAGTACREAIMATKGGKGLRICDVAAGRKIVGHLRLSDVHSIHVERRKPGHGGDEHGPEEEVGSSEYWKEAPKISFARRDLWHKTQQDSLKVQTVEGSTLYLRFYSDLDDAENQQNLKAGSTEFGVEDALHKNNAFQWVQTIGRFRGPEQLHQSLPHFGSDTDAELRDYLVHAEEADLGQFSHHFRKSVRFLKRSASHGEDHSESFSGGGTSELFEMPMPKQEKIQKRAHSDGELARGANNRPDSSDIV